MMRKWRVGTVSMGILLVATGILLLASELYGFNGAMLILRWWPVILIFLGIEILAYIFLSQDDQPKIKFDGLSIFLTILILLVSTGVYATHSFMKSDLADRFFDEIGFYRYEATLDKSFEVEADGVERLEIDNSHGDVNIESYDGNTIRIDAYIMVKSNNEQAAAKIAEDLIEITEAQTTTVKSRNTSQILDSNKQQISVDYFVKVPKELSYDINNRFGDITLENLDGDIKVESGFGQIETKDIQGDLRLENSHGDVQIRDINGKVEAYNEHGSISYTQGGQALKDIIMKTKYGSIVAEFAEGQQGVFKAETSFGQIQLKGLNAGEPVETDRNEREWEHTIGTDSPAISLEAEHGNITIAVR